MVPKLKELTMQKESGWEGYKELEYKAEHVTKGLSHLGDGIWATF